MRHHALLAVVTWILLAPSFVQGASLSYLLTDLGPGAANKINDSGQVIGSNGVSSYLYYNGTTQFFPKLDGAVFGASGISNNGNVAGTVTFADRPYHYSLGVYSNGSVQIIDSPVGIVGTAINDRGQVIGDSPFTYRAYLYSDGTFTTINPLSGDTETVSRGINGAGDVLVLSAGFGDRAAIFSHNQLTVVPGAEGISIQPFGINDSGDVVGFTTDRIERAVLLSGGQVTYLGLIPGTVESYAYAINDSGLIIGNGRTSNDGPLAGVYSPETGWTDLNTAVINAAGWDLQAATSVNDSGQIVGYGVHDGVNSGYLLTPVAVPEPATSGTFAFAVLTLGVWKLRQAARKVRGEA